MMDIEKKSENDEDEKVKKEVKDLENILFFDVDGGFIFDLEFFENFISKRGFLELLNFDSVVVEEDENKYVFKRMKLVEVEFFKFAEQGVRGLETFESIVLEVDIFLEEAVKEFFLSDCLDGSICFFNVFFFLGSLSIVDFVFLKTDIEKKFVQEMVFFYLEREFFFFLKEISVSCIIGNGEIVFKCNECGYLFFFCFDLEKYVECYL